MTTIPNIDLELEAYEAGALLPAYSPAALPGIPDAKVTWATLRQINRTETLTNKTLNTPATAKPAFVTTLQLPGAKITNVLRAAGSLTIPAINSDEEGTATFTVTGAAVGDAVIVNPTATPPANLVVAWAWISAADTVSVRIRKQAAGNYAGGSLAIIATVIRSTAPDV